MSIFIIIIAYLVFLLSTTFHEASHAFAAKLGGDSTAYNSGQVSLDPLPHIKREPMGMVLVPLLSLYLYTWPFGWASAPYNALWEREYPRRAALMALAGPAANLLLVIISGLILKVGLKQGFFNYDEVFSSVGYLFKATDESSVNSSLSGIIRMLGVFFDINMVLFLLNLFPLPGLDGSSIITLVLPRKAINPFLDFINNPFLSFISLILIWNIFPYFFWPFYLIVRGLII